MAETQGWEDRGGGVGPESFGDVTLYLGLKTGRGQTGGGNSSEQARSGDTTV